MSNEGILLYAYTEAGPIIKNKEVTVLLGLQDLLGILLSQLKVVHANDEQTQDAVEDWDYWVGRRYAF